MTRYVTRTSHTRAANRASVVEPHRHYRQRQLLTSSAGGFVNEPGQRAVDVLQEPYLLAVELSSTLTQ